MNSFFESLNEAPSTAKPTKPPITRRATRRGKKKKKQRDKAWLKKVEEAKIQQALMKKAREQYAQGFRDFKRLIETD